MTGQALNLLYACHALKFELRAEGIEPPTYSTSKRRSSRGFFCFEFSVGGRRIELLTSTMSMWRSTTKLTAHAEFGLNVESREKHAMLFAHFAMRPKFLTLGIISFSVSADARTRARSVFLRTRGRFFPAVLRGI